MTRQHRTDLQHLTLAASWPWARVLWAVALAAWATLIARVTLVPEIGGTGTIYRLVAGVTEFLTAGRVTPTFLVVEGIGNVLMFVPYGLLWAVVLAYPVRGVGPRRLAVAFAAAAVISLVSTVGIEAAQGAFFAGRVSESRDVLHNAVGGVAGAAVVPLAELWRSRHRRQGQHRPQTH